MTPFSAPDPQCGAARLAVPHLLALGLNYPGRKQSKRLGEEIEGAGGEERNRKNPVQF